jgi:hypothetical protein
LRIVFIVCLYLYCGWGYNNQDKMYGISLDNLKLPHMDFYWHMNWPILC